MRLNLARIKNFRSIKHAHITFDPRCRILVGINESGKSNLLAALELLDPTSKTRPEDIRVPLPSEKPIQEAWVRFDLRLEPEEISSAANRAASKLLGRPDQPLARSASERIPISKLIRNAPTVIYNVQLAPQSKHTYSYYRLRDDLTPDPDWMMVAPTCPPTLSIDVGGEAVLLASYSLVNIKQYPMIPHAHLTSVKPDDIATLYANAIIAEARERPLPSVVTWAYDDGHLLPAAINADAFIADPTTCLPLRNMFLLAGHSDIGSAFAEASKTAVGRRNLLKRVADKATRHLHRVWRDSTKLKLELVPDGPMIRASVLDTFNSYEFSRRSDGFKRFVSFLLVVSATERTGELRDTLLLVDEPEGGLHPSGARFLRDELLRTARTNYVVYSTHSTFMIDAQRIDRHIVVTKRRETTSVEPAGKSDVFEEEVLYNALGASIFEHLKGRNGLFEGWRDRRLFLVALGAKFGSEASRLVLKEVGHCFGRGVKSIKAIAPLVQLAQRQLLVVTDDDQVAIQEQRAHIEARGHGTWLRYSELMKDPGRLVTSEDFIQPGAFVAALKAARAERPELPIDTNPDWEHPKGRLASIRAWLARSGVTVDKQSVVIDSLKDFVFDELEAADIHETYGEVIDGLAKAIESL